MSILLFFRLGGIALGIITLLGMATDFLHIRFDLFFTGVLLALQDIGEAIVAAPLIERALNSLREIYPWVPQPAEHWRPLYTLTALLLVSIARSERNAIIHIPVALVFAAVSAIYAGTLPLDSVACVSFPLAAFCAYAGVGLLLDRNLIGGFLYLVGTAIIVAWTLISGERGAYLLAAIPLIIIWTLILLVGSLAFDTGTIKKRLQNPLVSASFNILGTLGGALFIGYLFAA